MSLEVENIQLETLPGWSHVIKSCVSSNSGVTRFDVMFCVIFFGVCSLPHVTSCSATRWIPSVQAYPPITCAHCPGGCLSAGGWERRGQGGSEEAKRRPARRGGSQPAQETWEDPQVHRHTSTNKVTAWFSFPGQKSHEIFKQLLFSPKPNSYDMCDNLLPRKKI